MSLVGPGRGRARSSSLCSAVRAADARSIRSIPLLLLVALVALVSLPVGVQAETIAALAARALALDPAVAGAAAQLEAAQERAYQARAAFGPTAGLSFNSSRTRYREEPARELRPFGADQLTLQVTQPLLRNTLQPALDVAQAQVEQAGAALVQARTESIQRLVEACFEVFKARDLGLQLRAQSLAVAEQQAAARRAYELGRAPITEVRDAEALAARVAAQAVAVQRDLELRRQVVDALVGGDGLAGGPDLLALSLQAEQVPALDVESMPAWLARAQRDNAGIAQALRQLDAADAELTKAWQGHAPTVDLNYTFSRSRDGGTVTSLFPRRGEQSSLGVTLNVPLFAGGATQSRVREAKALRDKAASELAAAQRNAALGVRQAFAAASASIVQASALQTAVASQALALRAKRRGVEVGMGTHAEALEAQTRLLESERESMRAVYEAWMAWFRLAAQAGGLTLSEIDPLDRLLVVRPQPALQAPSVPGRARAGATP